MMMISEWASRLGGCFGSWDYFGAAYVHTPTSCGVKFGDNMLMLPANMWINCSVQR